MARFRERRSYCVYITGSLPGTLYVGVTGRLYNRAFDHKFHRREGFTNKYDVDRLLYWESYDDVHKAIGREKQLKGWRRAKKVALIESINPHWLDLAKDWYPWMKESGAGRDAVLRGAQDLGARLERRATASTSTPSDRSQATGQPPLSMTKQEEK